MKILKKEMLGLFLLVFSLLIFISILGYDITEQPSGLGSPPNSALGYFGVYVGFIHHFILGYCSLSIPIILSIVGYSLFSNQIIKKYNSIILYIFLISIWISVILHCFGYNYLSGNIGYLIALLLKDIFGSFGRWAVILLVSIFLIIMILKISVYKKISVMKKFFLTYSNVILQKLNFFSNNFINRLNRIRNNKTDINVQDEKEIIINVIDDEFLNDEKIKSENEFMTDENSNFDNDPKDIVTKDFEDDESDGNLDSEEGLNDIVIEEEANIVEGDLDKKNREENKYLNYKLPDSTFLNDSIDIVNHSQDSLKEKADQLSYALNSFGVSGNIVKISPGPVITLFEIEPAEGVRVNKFTNLSEDLSRIMGGKRVRIIAPIPGSRSVGMELPNDSPSIVYLKSIINSKKYIDNSSKLKIALGKTTTGDAFFFELNKMPHLLVAGATGAGKSVCINTIIISILYNAKPDEVKFILLDPKKVELTTYKSLVEYHLITAEKLDEYVMTTSENSVSILNSAINEMERRFQVFSDVRVRNLDEYNKKKKNDSSLENIPYIVVIIDELADLMMTSGRAIEEPITRLAQKARAVGMHLIVATQRPSVDVITGLIKSNFPARISFQVSSKIDSRTIIDQMGAEKLLGRGDMLFLAPGSASPIRLHNAFVTLEEIEKIMDHITSQPKPQEIKLPEIKKMESDNDFSISDNQDELLKDAAILVVDAQQASVSLLQRKFRIGYSRAGRIVDELESLGIISGYSGSKAREVLVDHTYINEIFKN